MGTPLGTLWAYEARRCRPSTLALPMVAATGIAAVAFAVASTSGSSRENVGLGMVRLAADLFPVTAGLAACVAVGNEPLVELHVTVATSYPVTVRRRLLLVGVSTLVGAMTAVGAIGAAGYWNSPARGALALLIPLGPAVFLGGTALWAQAVLRSTAAASTIVITMWLAQLAVIDRWVTGWHVNRLLLIAAGIGLVAAGLRRLADGERLLGGTER